MLLLKTEVDYKYEISFLFGVWIKQLSIECRKTKTRVVTLTNQGRKTNHWFNQNLKQLFLADTKSVKICVCKWGKSWSRLAEVHIMNFQELLNFHELVWFTFDLTRKWHEFLHVRQSRGGVMQNQSKRNYLQSKRNYMWHSEVKNSLTLCLFWCKSCKLSVYIALIIEP